MTEVGRKKKKKKTTKQIGPLIFSQLRLRRVCLELFGAIIILIMYGLLLEISILLFLIYYGPINLNIWAQFYIPIENLAQVKWKLGVRSGYFMMNQSPQWTKYDNI